MFWKGKAFKGGAFGGIKKSMNPRIRIVLAFGLLVFFAFAIWKPAVTGGSVAETTQDVVVMLKPEVSAPGITGAVAMPGSVEEAKVKTKQVQKAVLDEVNKPSFIESVLNIEPDPEVEPQRTFEVVPGMVVKATPKGVEELEKNPNVEAVYPNVQFELLLDESVPLVNADDVWPSEANGVPIDGAGVSVCVVDTGIQADHPMFGERVVDEKCFCSGDCCPNGQDEDVVATDTHPLSHGTHVSGIVAGDAQYKGVAPGANIVAVKVCSTGCGLFDILSGIDYCLQVKDDFNVVAISGSLGDGGKYEEQAECPTFFDSAIDAAFNAGIVSVFASGNNGYSDGISYPGCSPNAMAVGASDKADNLASFSNRGALLEVLAPGVSITSAKVSDSYGALSGTSQATPHVSGAVALMQQYAQVTESPVTPADISNTLVSTGTDVSGFPRIDVRAALEEMGLTIQDESNGTNETNETNETNAPPVPVVVNPEADEYVTSPVSLEGSATDAEDGALPGSSLTWKEGETVLGTGSPLSQEFANGEHTVTLVAADSQSATGEAQVTFNVPTCVAELDMNGDALLNIGDIIVLLTDVFQDNLQCLTLEAEPVCELDLDQTGDGVVNIGDVIVLLTGILEENLSDSNGNSCFA